MSRIHLQCSDADLLDHSVAADFIFRQEPDEDEEEEEDDNNRKEDDDENDDGYSE
jgi:hypothetical protein